MSTKKSTATETIPEGAGAPTSEATVPEAAPAVEGGETKAEEKKPDAPAEVVETKTVEAWATAKGMLPQIFPGGTLNIPQGRGLQRVRLAQSGAVAPRANMKYAAFAAAKAMHNWPEGLVMTEADFDAKVRAAYDDVKLG